MAVLACMLFGCAGSGGKGEPGPDIRETAEGRRREITFPLNEQITITAMVRDFNRDRTREIDRILEEKTNIRIEWTIVSPTEYAAVFEQKFHSGELPDLFETWKEAADRFCDEGEFVDFSGYLDQMPHLRAWMEKIPAIYNDTADGEGRLYCLTTFNTRGQAPKQSIYRKDLFEKEGIKAPENLEELYDALVKLKEKYPDSIPVGNRWGLENLLAAVAGLYHTRTGFYLDNEELVYQYGPATEEFRAAVATLQKFYKKGLIDPEFATISDEQFVKNITDGKTLFLFSEYLCCLNTKAQGDWNGEGKKKNPAFEMAPLTPMDTELGKGLIDVQAPTSRGHFAVGVNSRSKYIDEMIALLDYQYSDEIIDLVNWGVEDETYEMKDGDKKWLIGEAEREEKGLDARSGMWVPIDQDCSDATLDARDRELITKANARAEEFAFYEPKKTLAFTGEEKEILEGITDALNKYTQEKYLKFITGELNMEKNWEDFVQGLEDAGYKEALEIYRKNMTHCQRSKKGWIPVLAFRQNLSFSGESPGDLPFQDRKRLGKQP